jgi:hypothetical protein
LIILLLVLVFSLLNIVFSSHLFVFFLINNEKKKIEFVCLFLWLVVVSVFLFFLLFDRINIIIINSNIINTNKIILYMKYKEGNREENGRRMLVPLLYLLFSNNSNERTNVVLSLLTNEEVSYDLQCRLYTRKL